MIYLLVYLEMNILHVSHTKVSRCMKDREIVYKTLNEPFAFKDFL